MKRSLFHYSTIDTLEAILTHKTLRFQSLEYVDDPQEAEIYGSERMGRVGFVSCWTDTPSESIPMWREYTGGDCDSIRIETSSELFDEITENEAFEIGSTIRAEQDFSISPPYKPVIFPITYTSDRLLLKPKLMHKSQQICEGDRRTESWTMNTELLGRFKNMAWSEQHEWRFLLIAIPMEVHRRNQNGNFLKGGDSGSLLSIEESNNMILDATKDAIENIPLPSKYVDFPVNIKKFGPFSITLHPNISEQGRQRVSDLANCFHLNCSVRNSELRFH